MKFQTSHTIPFMQTGAIIQTFPCTPGLDFAKFEMDDEPSSNLLEHYGSAPPQSAVRFSPGHGPAEGYDSILTEAPRSRSGMDMASMDMSSMLAADTNSHAEGASLEWLQAEMQDLVDAIQEIAEVEASGVQVRLFRPRNVLLQQAAPSTCKCPFCSNRFPGSSSRSV